MDRIVYLDTFCPEHSGRFWKKAFEQHGNVTTFEVGGLKDPQQVLRNISSIQPSHIHFGGSTQSEKTFKISDIKRLKQTGAKITFFYGDGYHNLPYYLQLADIVDDIYVTNKSFCVRDNIHFTMCPAPKEMAKKLNVKKDLDVVFIGNNYNRRRREALYKIYGFLGNRLTVFGKGWKKRKINTKGPISYEKFPEICQRARIILGDPAGPICFYSHRTCQAGNPDGIHSPGYCRAYGCSKYEMLRGYISNRVSNILMSGGTCLMPYVEGLEDLLEDGKHLLMYRDWDELKAKIDINTSLLAGQQLVLRHYTFEAAAERMLNG